MSDEHSPVPWADDTGFINDANGTTICTVDGSAWIGGITTTYETDKANAEFLVKAVNNHDKLVEALERIIFGYDDGEQCISDLDIEFARDRVAKAKGGD